MQKPPIHPQIPNECKNWRDDICNNPKSKSSWSLSTVIKRVGHGNFQERSWIFRCILEMMSSSFWTVDCSTNALCKTDISWKRGSKFALNPSTRVGHHRVDLNLKVLSFSTDMTDFQIFCNVSSLIINHPNSRIKNFHFFEFLIGKFRNRPCGGRLLLRGY